MAKQKSKNNQNNRPLRNVKSSFWSNWLLPFKTIYNVYKILAQFYREAKQITFDEEQLKNIKLAIRNKSSEILLNNIQEYGVNIISQKTKSQAIKHLNEEMLKLACTPSNEQIQSKMEKLLGIMLQGFDQTSIYSTTHDEVQDFINNEINIWHRGVCCFVKLINMEWRGNCNHKNI